MKPYKVYSSVLNRQPCMFISGKVCILTLIEAKRQTLPEINIQGCLFRALEYKDCGPLDYGLSWCGSHRKISHNFILSLIRNYTRLLFFQILPPLLVLFSFIPFSSFIRELRVLYFFFVWNRLIGQIFLSIRATKCITKCVANNRNAIFAQKCQL